MSSAILQTKDLCKYYGSGENQVKAVDHINLEIKQGEFAAIVGKSGSGKSTICTNFTKNIEVAVGRFFVFQ